jgi:hypothetical protein
MKKISRSDVVKKATGQADYGRIQIKVNPHAYKIYLTYLTGHDRSIIRERLQETVEKAIFERMSERISEEEDYEEGTDYVAV